MKRHTDYTSGDEDTFIEELELTNEQRNALYSIMDRIVTKAYEDGLEDGENGDD